MSAGCGGGVGDALSSARSACRRVVQHRDRHLRRVTRRPVNLGRRAAAGASGWEHRIVSAEPTEQPAQRPDDFTLATAWQQVVGEVEERRSRTWATVITEARIVPALRYQFGRHCHTEGEATNGRVRVRVGAPTPIDIARHLAGWGELIDVVEPETVQTLLAHIGAELTARYAT
jgi:hypothetical protein